MATSIKFLLSLSLLFTLLASTPPISTAIRPLASPSPSPMPEKLVKAADDNSSLTTCWDSLLELQSCSSEIILFLVNGETSLGPECCDAIRIIEYHCWPSMLASLGYDSEESDVLRGYCDTSETQEKRKVGEHTVKKVNQTLVKP